MVPQFNQKAQEAIERAQQYVMEYHHSEIHPLHLLLALIEQEDSIVSAILDTLQVNINNLSQRIKEKLTTLPRFLSVPGFGQIMLSQETVMVLDTANRIARELNEKNISTEHLLLGIIENKNEASDILKNFDLNGTKIREALEKIKSASAIDEESGAIQYKVLEKYSINLTELARQEKLDPLIGRDEELYHIMQILSRRTKNNPVLLGEPGVGKTAIVEGLAQKIIKQEVPENLKNKEILSLDIGSMIAGTKFRGEFEERLKGVLKEILANKDKYIIFIDELQTIVGAGAAEGSIDASNLLKPALARGDLRLIGATTYKDYRESIEKDPALERRFQPVIIDEPTIEETLAILRGLKPKYEVFHGVKITDEAIREAVVLSSRYIPDRFLPDKAIDLIDEAASRLKLQINSVPPEIAKVEHEIRLLEIEKEALKKEEDKISKKRLTEIEKELNQLKEKHKELMDKWKEEKNFVDKIHDLKKQLESLEKEAANYERNGALDKVAEIYYGKIPQIKKEIEKLENTSKKKSKEYIFIKEEVTGADIAKIVAQWTNIPIERMLEDEKQKLANMEVILSKRVVGQEEAIQAVSRAIKRSRAGISEEDRPIGSFMFLGPTGVGKTELARALAEFMFNDEKAMIRIDMSEYMEKHSVARLIGSPPGYVGYEEGGQLTEAIRHKPYSLILFDEIEKAHPEVFNILLQILDNGRLTDGKGRIVNFKNTIIIMTSNIGGEYISQMASLGFSQNNNEKEQIAKEKEYEKQKEILKEKIQEGLKEYFRPEFLNRIDEIIIFNPLREKDIEKIVDIQVEKIKERLLRQSIKLNIGASAKKWLAKNGYDSQYGARPLKRLIQKSILDPIADYLIRGEVKEGSTINVEEKNGKLNFQISHKKTK